MNIYQTFSSGETEKLGKFLAGEVLKTRGNREAVVIGLVGHLGTGKTTFVSGFLRGLGIKKRSPSPTFVLMRRTALHKNNFKNFYHVDAYRVKKPREMLKLGIGEIFNDSRNIVMIEWADRIRKILPGHFLKINFEHGKKENERIISLTLQR